MKYFYCKRNQGPWAYAVVHTDLMRIIEEEVTIVYGGLYAPVVSDLVIKRLNDYQLTYPFENKDLDLVPAFYNKKRKR